MTSPAAKATSSNKTQGTKQAPTSTNFPAPPLPPMGDDIVDDMLRVCLALAPGFSAALADQAARQIRERWGGDRVYIARRPGAGTSERNAAIWRDHCRGERSELLQRRYGLSRSQIWEILRQMRPSKA